MKKYTVFMILALILLSVIGCVTDVPDTEREEDTTQIMNVSIEQIEQITLYSEAEEKMLKKDSEQFLRLAAIIEKSEDIVDIIDGGVILSMYEIGDRNYAKLSKEYKCDVYIIDLVEDIQVKYASYQSKDNTVVSIFVIPKHGEFGVVLKSEDSETLHYATLSNVEKNVFAEFIE